MTFVPHRYCSLCLTFETTHWNRSRIDRDLWWCNKCFMSWYNEKHRAQKNSASREYMRHKNKIKKKKPTIPQTLATSRHLKWELKRAETKLEFLKWVSTPEPILQHNEIWRSLPGVS